MSENKAPTIANSRERVQAEAKRLGLFDFMVSLATATGRYHNGKFYIGRFDSVTIYENDEEKASYELEPQNDARAITSRSVNKPSGVGGNTSNYRRAKGNH